MFLPYVGSGTERQDTCPLMILIGVIFFAHKANGGNLKSFANKEYASLGGHVWMFFEEPYPAFKNGDYDTGFSFSSPAAMAGYPHITVPMGVIHDLPIGFSFAGTPYTEPQLIGMAYAYEQVTNARVAPRFIASI